MEFLLKPKFLGPLFVAVFFFLPHQNIVFAQVETNFSGGGAVRIGDSTTTCDNSIVGALRYDADAVKSIDYCNGSSWITLLTSTIGGGVVNNGNSFAAPMVIGTNDTNTLGFETNGITRLQIDDDSYSIAMGKVPDTPVPQDRVFEMKAANNGTTSLRLNASANSTGAIGEIDFKFDDVSVAQIRSQKSGTGLTNSGLVFQTHDGTSLFESMRISKDGYVGIGTNNPNSILNVSATTNTKLTILDSTTTGFNRVLSLRRENPSGVGGNTMGSQVDFEYEGNTEGSTITGARISNRRQGDFSLDLNNGGSLQNKLTIDATNFAIMNSNAGIGSSSPTARLDVKGSGNTSGASTLKLQNSSGTTYFDARNDGVMMLGPVVDPHDSRLALADETSPTYPAIGTWAGGLHILPEAGIDGNSGAITFGANSGGGIEKRAEAGIYVQSSSAYGTRMHLATSNNYANGSQARVSILEDGKVGIGTATPNYRFVVDTPTFWNNTSTKEKTAQFTAWSGGPTANNNDTIALASYSQSAGGGAGNTSTAIEAYGATENDGVAQSTYGLTTFAETHAGDTGYGLAVYDGTNTSGGTVYGVYIDLTDTDSTRFGVYQNSANINYFAGNVGIGTNNPSHILHITGQGRSTNSAWATTSDRRLKNVQGPYQYGMEEIAQLDTFWFQYKKNNPLSLPSDKDFMGVMAQDLMTIIPEAVQKGDDGYYTVNTDPIFWALVNATQEVNNKCEATELDLKKLAYLSLQNKRDLASLKEKGDQRDLLIKELKDENKKLKEDLKSIHELLQKNGIR